MRRTLLSLFALFTCYASLSAQVPGMTSWVSNTVNETQVRLRIHDQAINNAYALAEVSFSMSAARCALSDLVTLSIYEDDGSGTYGSERYTTSFNPGPGSVAISVTEKDRILINSSGNFEDLYVLVEISGASRPNDFSFVTPNCRTTIVSYDTFDPCGTIPTAASIPLNTLYQGLILDNNHDLYQLTLDEARQLQVSMKYLNDYSTSIANLDLDLYVINASTEVLAFSASTATSTTSQIEEVIDEVLPAGTYYIRVAQHAGVASRNFYDLEVSTEPIPTYSISGYVLLGDNSGLPGTSLQGFPTSVLTDAAGFYTTDVPHAWSGTITPSAIGYQFTPASRSYSDVKANFSSQDYAAVLNTYTISGRITDDDDLGIEGVLMKGFPDTLYTDEEGYYSGVVDYGWSDTIFPRKLGLIISPAFRHYNPVNTNIPNQDYSAEYLMITIRGKVEMEGSSEVLEGVTINGSPGPVMTDADGMFRFDIRYGTLMTLTPVKEGYSFDPVSVTRTANVYWYFNFYASLNTYMLDGYVRDAEGTGMQDVVLNGLPGNPGTLADGSYEVTVDHGWSGTVVPTLEGYSFDPDTSIYTQVTEAGSQDYTGSQLPYLEASSTQITLAPEMGVDQTVSIHSNIDWVVSETSDWLTVTPASGSNDDEIIISASSANESVESRTAIVAVTGGDITHNIEVIQSGAEASLELSSPRDTLASAAGSFFILDITSNIAWTATENADWLSVSPASGTGDQVITLLAVSENTEASTRTTTLTVEGESIVRVISITQAAAEITGVEDILAQMKLELYPNPAMQHVFIRSDTELQAELSLKVVSITGKVMYEEQLPFLIPGEPAEIDLSDFPAGQYLVQIGNEYVQRVFKLMKYK